MHQKNIIKQQPLQWNRLNLRNITNPLLITYYTVLLEMKYHKRMFSMCINKDKIWVTTVISFHFPSLSHSKLRALLQASTATPEQFCLVKRGNFWKRLRQIVVYIFSCLFSESETACDVLLHRRNRRNEW